MSPIFQIRISYDIKLMGIINKAQLLIMQLKNIKKTTNNIDNCNGSWPSEQANYIN